MNIIFYKILHIHDNIHSLVALPNVHPNACMQSREAVCTIFMLVFGMTRLWRKPMMYPQNEEEDMLTT